METITDILQNAPVNVISRDDKAGIYVVCFIGTATEVCFHVYGIGGGSFDCQSSHYIKPKGFTIGWRSSHTEEATKALTLKKALKDMSRSYQYAVKSGHRPNRSWFVRNDS